MKTRLCACDHYRKRHAKNADDKVGGGLGVPCNVRGCGCVEFMVAGD